MSLTVFAAVIGAAMLHAVWNAIVKGADDKEVNMAAVVAGHAPAAALALAISGSPAPASYPFIVVGAALHVGYQFFLLWAYRAGEFTQVYPIARGVAPLIISAISVFVLGVFLSPVQILAIMVIAAGLFSLVLVRRSTRALNIKAAGLAIVTGCFIAAYSLVDGLGARAAGTSFGYYSVLALINAVIFSVAVSLYKPGTIRRLLKSDGKAFFIGGTASFSAYAIVTWAFTKAPIALVSALRETSIVFALLIGVFVLRERLDLQKIASTFAVLIGAAMLRIAR